MNYKKWKEYAVLNGFIPIPGMQDEIGEYLISLVTSVSLPVIRQIIASINYFHKLFGFEGPCGRLLDGLVNDYILKFCSKPKVQREPILINHLERIFNLFCFKNCSLYFLRSLGILVLGFFGFLRFSDFCNLRLSDVLFKKDKIVIFIRKSKTDRFREGQSVSFDNGSFPAKFVSLYFKRFCFSDYVDSDDYFVFMSMKRKQGECLIYRDYPVSYSSCSRIVRQLFEKAGIPSKLIKVHSLRIGGATESSRLGVPDFLVGANGRWKSDSSRRLYQRDPGVGNHSVSMVLSRGLSLGYPL